MNEYFINSGTCAIVPIGEELSKVIEIDNEYIINRSVKDIVNDSCKYFGSSYNGRFDGSKKILKMNYKLPIVIEETKNLIFFPTSSPRFDECTWISLNNVSNYEKNGKNTIVYFKSRFLELNISYYSLENQIFRATMLDSILRKRKGI
jgi:competence protein ComK